MALILCLLLVAVLTGCTQEKHRVWITIKNDTNESETIEFFIDDDLEISTTIEPKASVEEKFELSQGDHTFALYREVNGTFELYKTQDIPIEADDSVFFEIE